MKFEDYAPCIYFQNILCVNCEQHKVCDMEAGRTLYEKYYKAGFEAGKKDHYKYHQLEGDKTFINDDF